MTAQNDERCFGIDSSRWVLLLGALIGVACFIYYYRLGITTAHYDAKAHLVVARRMVDSVDPGYDQLGTNWLPLLHLIYLPLVLLESQYRTALLPSLISVCAYAFSGWLVYRIAYRATAAKEAAWFSALIFLANANLQYLQSCPLTEPLCMVLLLLSLDSLMKWRERALPVDLWMTAAGATLAALCRYEGWYFVGALGLIPVYDYWSRRISKRQAIRALLVIGGCFVLIIGLHFGYIYWHLRDSFIQKVVQGNPVPEEGYRRPLRSMLLHLTELWQIAGTFPLLVGFGGIWFFLGRREKWPQWMPLVLLWIPSLVNISALFWGMVYRVRYSTILIPAVAVFAGLSLISIRWPRRLLLTTALVAINLPWLAHFLPDLWRYHIFYRGPGIMIIPAAATLLFLIAAARQRYRWPLLVLCVLSMQIPLLNGENRALLAETLEHDAIEAERHEVLRYFARNYDGTKILIDMGKLAPLIYDSGLPIKEFVYNEGINTHWHKALQDPTSEAGWLCAQEGDEIWQRLHVDPDWIDGYSLAIQTKSFLIYRKKSETLNFIAPVGQSQ